MIKMLMYGSLRNGEYNFNHFSKNNNMVYVKTIQIPGFDLYSFGSHPAAIESTEDRMLTVDIMEVTPECKKRLDSMELGAGYKIVNVEVEGEIMQMYAFGHADYARNSLPHVKSGDWSAYLQEQYVY